MVDLHSISSNLLLVGFVLISLCCLYLLYSNFSKVRETNELKRNVEDLKTIFLNQQKQNDKTYNHFMNIISNETGVSMNNISNIINNDDINIEDISKQQPTIIKLTKENIENIKNLEVNLNNKLIQEEVNSMKLDDLKELDDLSSNNDDIINDIDINDNLESENEEIKTDNKDNTDDFDDIDSITTEPMNEYMEDNKFDIEDMEDLAISLDNNENIDKNNNNNLDTNFDNLVEELDSLDTDLDEDLDNLDTDLVEDLDNLDIDLNKDLDNLDTDLDADLDNLNTDLDEELNTINIKKLEKIKNINNTLTLEKTIINSDNIDKNNDIKTISLNENENENENEIMGLDKLLSGEVKNINIKKISENITTTINKQNNYTLEALNDMSIKNLKEITKEYKIKSYGNKSEIIQTILNYKN